MKRLFNPRPFLLLLTLSLASLVLPSCQVAGRAWNEAYRHKGGYYDKDTLVSQSSQPSGK